MNKMLIVLSSLALSLSWGNAGKTKTYCGSAKANPTFGRVNFTPDASVNGHATFELLANNGAEQVDRDLSYIRQHPRVTFQVCVQSKELPESGIDSVFLPISNLQFQQN